SRRDEAAVGCPLGCHPTYFLGLDHHDSRIRGNGNGCIRGAAAHVWSLRPAGTQSSDGQAAMREAVETTCRRFGKSVKDRRREFEAVRHVEAIPRFRSWAPARI